MFFLCGISPTCPWRPSDCQNLCLPTTHVVPAASALWPAVPRVPVWPGDGLRDWTWLPPGVTFGLRNNGCALLPPPLSSLTSPPVRGPPCLCGGLCGPWPSLLLSDLQPSSPFSEGRGLSSLPIFRSACRHTSKMYFPVIF